MKLFAFGDSFTEPFHIQTGQTLKYFDWKGYIPKNFVDNIAENLKLNYFNFGRGGTSNRTILSTFIKNIDLIDENDIVIIGWTSLARYRIPDYEENFFDVIAPNFIIKPYQESPSIESTLIDNLLIRDHPMFSLELMEYMKLIRKSLPKCQIFFWTWHWLNLP